jgi:hypothetical protein
MKDQAIQYLALDVHQATTVATVRNGDGSIRMRATVPTEASAILGLVRGLGRRVHVAFEEGRKRSGCTIWCCRMPPAARRLRRLTLARREPTAAAVTPRGFESCTRRFSDAPGSAGSSAPAIRRPGSCDEADQLYRASAEYSLGRRVSECESRDHSGTAWRREAPPG